MATEVSGWTCSKCTFINDNNDDENNDKCTICREPRTDNHGGSSTHRDSLRRSIQFSELVLRSGHQREEDGNEFRRSATKRDSITALGNMSFAAWESDRRSWACKACTFVNEPRYLICGGCGMGEGSSCVVEDELITYGLSHLSLSTAQQFLIDNVQAQLNNDREDHLRKERIMELVDDQIRLECANKNGLSNRKATNSNDEEEVEVDQEKIVKIMKTREHIEKLERIQAAEKEEHEEMLFTLEQWRVALRADPILRHAWLNL